MNAPTPHPDDYPELREALRRDAARMHEPPFDAALHQATMRRIRALSNERGMRLPLRLIPALAAGVALLVIVMSFAHREPPPARPDVAAAIASSQNAIARLSLESDSPLPTWISPTASLLDEPRYPK